jgi:3-deoxy-7-phosphoheptulonate synthase
MKYLTDDIRITGMEEVIAPEALIDELPITAAASRTTFTARKEVSFLSDDCDDVVTTLAAGMDPRSERALDFEDAAQSRRANIIEQVASGVVLCGPDWHHAKLDGCEQQR